MNSKLGISAFALAAFMGMFAANANASCASGLIEVKDNGVEMCVTPEEFANLSDAVKATADADDVEEALSGEDDEQEGVEDSSNEPDESVEGPENEGPESEGPENEGPENDGPDDDSSDNESDGD